MHQGQKMATINVDDARAIHKFSKLNFSLVVNGKL